MSAMRYVDADGHVVEHPTGIAEHAPHAWRDRVWHVEADGDGQEWVVFDGHREKANVYTAIQFRPTRLTNVSLLSRSPSVSARP